MKKFGKYRKVYKIEKINYWVMICWRRRELKIFCIFLVEVLKLFVKKGYIGKIRVEWKCWFIEEDKCIVF